jgi:hypothetical protein
MIYLHTIILSLFTSVCPYLRDLDMDVMSESTCLGFKHN